MKIYCLYHKTTPNPSKGNTQIWTLCEIYLCTLIVKQPMHCLVNEHPILLFTLEKFNIWSPEYQRITNLEINFQINPQITIY